MYVLCSTAMRTNTAQHICILSKVDGSTDDDAVCCWLCQKAQVNTPQTKQTALRVTSLAIQQLRPKLFKHLHYKTWDLKGK